MKKLWADLALILVLLLVAGGLYLAFGARGEDGAWAVVRVENEEIARYPLSEEGVFPLNGGTNILVIENGTARLSEADCPDKLCVRQGTIRYSGQVITCLPNRLTVTLEGGQDSGLDLIVG